MMVQKILLKDMDTDTLNAIADFMKVVIVKPGEIVYQEGNASGIVKYYVCNVHRTK